MTSFSLFDTYKAILSPTVTHDFCLLLLHLVNRHRPKSCKQKIYHVYKWMNKNLTLNPLMDARTRPILKPTKNMIDGIRINITKIFIKVMITKELLSATF